MAKEENKDAGFLDEVAGMGLDAVGADDRAIPFLRILQPLSPQVDQNEPEYVDGAVPGVFYNTVTNRIYGKEIKVIPVFFTRLWLEWKPDRGGLVDRHEPGSIEVNRTDFSNWKYSNPATGTINAIQDTYSFYILCADHIDEGPMVYPMQSTGIRHAKNWNSKIMLTRLPDSGKPAPYFANVWAFTVEKYKNEQGTFYQVGGKTTNLVQDRLITKMEYENYVKPTYDDISRIESRSDFSQLESNGKAQIEEGNDTAF